MGDSRRHKKSKKGKREHVKDKNIFVLICEYTEKHWIFTPVFLKASGLWYCLFLAFYGQDLFLIYSNDSGRHLTWNAWFVTVLLFIITTLISISERYGSVRNNKIKMQNNLYLLVNRSVSDICRQKVYSQVSQIKTIKNSRLASQSREGIKPIPEIYTNPDEQIKCIMDGLKSCLIELLSEDGNDVGSGDIVVDLVYKFPKENTMSRWQWALDTQHSISAFDIDGSKSTFAHLLKNIGKNHFAVFYNEKQYANEKGYYLKDSSDTVDEDGKIRGSIACFYFDFRDKDNEPYIQAMISVSTSKSEIIPLAKLERKSEDAQNKECKLLLDNMKDYLINNFKNRIGVELANKYMIFLNNQYNGKP